MDVAKDLMTDLRERLGRSGPAVPIATIAWPELHTRFAAAHAAAGELARGSTHMAGAFSLWHAAGGNASRPVNQAGLADGKSAVCIDYAIADEPTVGDRGQ